MPLDRPQEMPWYLPSLGLPPDLNPIAFVARNGGYRETDSLDVFPEVAVDPDSCYRFYFLLRKLYLVEEAAVDAVVRGDKIGSPAYVVISSAYLNNWSVRVACRRHSSNYLKKQANNFSFIKSKFLNP
jgi:hypothetical protein